MAKILSNNEIEALFAGQGGISDDSPAPVVEQEKPQKERSVKEFDFTKASRLSQDQVQGVWRIYEQLASRLQLSISSMLRLGVRVELMDLEQIRFETLLEDLQPPVVSVVLETEASPCGALLCMDFSLAYVLIERLLGGTGQGQTEENRALTPLECAAIDGLIEVVTEDLERAWEGLGRLGLRVSSYESNLQYVQAIPRKEVVVAATFGLGGELTFGEVRLLFPHLTLEPYLDAMSHQSPLGEKAKAPTTSTRVRVATSLHDTRLGVNVALGPSRVPMGDVIGLSVGDVIPLNHSLGKPLQLNVAGLPKFQGRAFLVDGQYSFRIESAVAGDVAAKAPPLPAALPPSH